MAAARKDKSGPVRYIMQHVKCADIPVCCVVAAVFRAEGWKNSNADSALSH
jgi:hypothetical protein